MEEEYDDEDEILLPKEKQFHEACRTGDLALVDALIAQKINVNCMDERDRTPLQLAAGQGHTEVIESLTDADARIDLADKFGMNALLWATWFGKHEAMKALVRSGADVKAENKQGMNIVHCAASRGHRNVLEYIVRELLDEDPMDSDYEEDDGGGISLNAVSGKVTGLFSAAGNMMGNIGNMAMGKPTEVKKKTRSVDSFAEKKTNKDDGGKSPLHVAAEHGQVSALEYLAKVKCNKFARANDGSTSLHLAAGNGHVDMVSTLLEYELEINIRNEEGKTPLLMAAESGHASIVELLLSKGADGNAQANERAKSMSAAHFAAKNDHPSVIKVLASNRCNLNSKAMYDNTPLHVASTLGHIESVKTLLSCRCKVNVLNEKRRSALHEATENGLADIVELLLVAGINVQIQEKNGKTALSMAARADNITIVDMIIKADRYFIKHKKRPGAIPDLNVLQFRKEDPELQEIMRPICYKLVQKQLAKDDCKRLFYYWGFKPEHIEAIETQETGKHAWKEHGYRMMLIWLHGLEDNPIKELYEGLTNIDCNKLAEQIRAKENKRAEANGSNCSLS
ncbi:ankyrin repeat and death domain-containing protein 1A [Strongylocentrotus purpuratus]|uniref:Death domain-containing protein n=1 Tax=Strongylocentrotus purpuratus TaxID=7668 RepID=A0A7M7SUN4_STRPU|nr:ankyrin repeat and death domain-containing protein 1A [Strongylocentrotus purpuratus]|eukprot:XP_011679497.1 PREDICTED: ankyrin repeat and death domain-containing protein 1A isoform X1 [Strongylocentrotus purpuratus]